MTSLITKVNKAIDTLKSELKNISDKYNINIFLRFPTASDSYPLALIVPIRVTPVYQGGLMQEDEYALLELELHLITKVPYDYKGSTLMSDLDLVLAKLRDLRHDETKWVELSYEGGIDFSYSDVEQWILQSAVVNLKIEI